jgi:hypothetical protein
LSSLDRSFNGNTLRYAAMATSRVFKATLPLLLISLLQKRQIFLSIDTTKMN